MSQLLSDVYDVRSSGGTVDPPVRLVSLLSLLLLALPSILPDQGMSREGPVTTFPSQTNKNLFVAKTLTWICTPP